MQPYLLEAAFDQAGTGPEEILLRGPWTETQWLKEAEKTGTVFEGPEAVLDLVEWAAAVNTVAVVAEAAAVLVADTGVVLEVASD